MSSPSREKEEEENKDGSRNHSSSPLKVWHRLAVQSSPPDTPADELIRRSSFMLIAILTNMFGFLFSNVYFFADKPHAAFYPATYFLIMTPLFICLLTAEENCSQGSDGGGATDAHNTTAGRQDQQQQPYHFLVNIHLLLILILPIGLQYELGGVVSSGGNMLGSFMSPMGASLFCRPRTAGIWFSLYVLLTILVMGSEWCWDHHSEKDVYSFDERARLSNPQIVLFAANVCGALSFTILGLLIFRINIDYEYNRQEQILHSTLPVSVAKRLKQGETQFVDNIDIGVGILFADLVGFTVAAAEIQPHFLIGMFLKDVFLAWDKVCEKHSIENIKTIGDAFMAVGGIEQTLSTSSSDQRSSNKEEDIAVRMVLVGLEMHRALNEVNERYQLKFKCRIGLHSGPVIAGVIGVKKLAFDVWGDAVNTASRMESHGIPGHLHISSNFYNAVKEKLSPVLDIKCRGAIDVKGKGKMTTYLIDAAQ
jgi:adenylate cyclase